MRRVHVLALGGACALLLPACEGDDVPGEVGRGAQALAYPGPWVIPADTLAIGDTQYVEYTGAGPWIGEEGCAGGLEPGAGILGDYLGTVFPQITHVGGYSCRLVNGSDTTMSVHATGRALDLMLPTIGDDAEADNDLGDPIGDFLVENAEAIGVQFIIWDRWDWMAERAEGSKGQAYTGAHPHNDHVHVELSVEAATQTTDWFSDAIAPPVLDDCLPLGPEGGILDELDPCFQAFGPWDYWRSVSDAGFGGSLLWTNAWENDAPSNWARWNVVLEAAGTYEVEVFLTAPWAVYAETRYGLRHAGVEEEVYLDQSAAEGWVSLGRYDFAEGGAQWVAVYDDVDGPVAADQHVAVDALRLVPVGGGGGGGGGGASDAGTMSPDPDGAVDPDGGTSGGSTGTKHRRRHGCATSGAPSDLGFPCIALALVALRARRRRAR